MKNPYWLPFFPSILDKARKNKGQASFGTYALRLYPSHPSCQAKKEKNIESAAKKSARVSALTGSVPHKMAKGLQENSEPCKNQTRVARLTETH